MILVALLAVCAIGIAWLEFRSERRSRAFACLEAGRSESGFADLLVYDQLVRPDVIRTKDDAYLAIWRFSAPDAGSLDEQSIINIARRTAAGFSTIPPGAIIQLYERRVQTYEYDRPPSYPSPIFRWLDLQRAEVFRTQELFASERFLSLTWKLPTSAQSRLSLALDSGAHVAEEEDALLADFDALCASVEAQLGTSLELTRIGESVQTDADGKQCLRSELLAFIASTVGGLNQPFNAPLPGTALDDLLAVEFVGGYEPKIGEDAVACVVLKTYPKSSLPRMLARLTELKIRHLFSVRFMPLTTEQAKKIFRNRLYDWMANANFNRSFVDPDAAEMSEDARQALGHASREMGYGMTTITLTLRDRDRARVDAAAREVIAFLADAGFQAFVPRLSALDTFLGVPPAMGYYDQRRLPLSAMNVAHIFPLHEDAQGSRYSLSPTMPRHVPPVAYALTPGNTQYRLHLNSGSDDTFHGLGIGAPGRGKSTILASLSAGWCGRMPAAGMSAIDRGRSLYRLTKWVGGNFYDLLGPNSPGFALFADIEDPEVARACLEIIEEMCELQGVVVTPPRREALERAMRIMPTYAAHLRNLTAYTELLQDAEGLLAPALKLYTRSGILGDLLDSTTDTWTTSTWNVVDISHIIGLRERYLIPILRVVFSKLTCNARKLREASGSSRLHWMYHIDEAHTLLGHPLGQKFVRELLKMGRKELAGIWLWSQSVTDFAATPIVEDLLKAAGTRIWFGDTGATVDAPEQMQRYKDLELPLRGIHRLAELPKWSMLLQQPSSQTLRELRLNFSPTELAVFGRSRPGDNQLVDELIASYPDTWRVELLRRENISITPADIALLSPSAVSRDLIAV